MGFIESVTELSAKCINVNVQKMNKYYNCYYYKNNVYNRALSNNYSAKYKKKKKVLL